MKWFQGNRKKFGNFFLCRKSRALYYYYQYSITNTNILLPIFVLQKIFFHIHNPGTGGGLKSNTNLKIEGFLSGKNVRMRE